MSLHLFLGILPLYVSPIFPQLSPFHPQMMSARGQVLLNFGLHESFTWTKRQIRETTENKESAAWRQVLSYKSLSATKAVFFFPRTNPSGGTCRQENASFLCYSISDDWQLIRIKSCWDDTPRVSAPDPVMATNQQAFLHADTSELQ